MIIPSQQLSFISSIPQLIQLFFTKMHCGYLTSIINGLIAIGCIGAANNWLIAPIKGLGFAAGDGFLNNGFTELNKNQAPATLLILQATCVSVISTLFLIIPSINASYWIMLNAATQINLLMYLLLFFSAIKLALLDPLSIKLKIIVPACLGLFGICAALFVSLALPPSLQFNSQLSYAVLGGLFLILMTLIPLWSQRRSKPRVSAGFET